MVEEGRDDKELARLYGEIDEAADALHARTVATPELAAELVAFHGRHAGLVRRHEGWSGGESGVGAGGGTPTSAGGVGGKAGRQGSVSARARWAACALRM